MPDSRRRHLGNSHLQGNAQPERPVQDLRSERGRTRVGLLVGLGIIVVLAVALSRRKMPSESASEAQPQPAAPTIRYTVVDSWSVNRGHVRMLVIDSTHRNEADLRTLGEQFRKDFSTEFNTAASVFDDANAVQLRNDYSAERLSKAQDAFFERHQLGQYIKNGTTGVHQFVIFPSGLNGPMVKLDYK